MNTTQLTVRITSFSFKKGIPEDPSGNGGGFVFDCRCIPNPGVYDEYKQLTGLDSTVQAYLLNIEITHSFIANIQSIVSMGINRYLEREFTHLMICFGCTGGQHRSVFFAEQLAEFIHKKFPHISIVINHREQGIQKAV